MRTRKRWIIFSLLFNGMLLRKIKICYVILAYDVPLIFECDDEELVYYIYLCEVFTILFVLLLHVDLIYSYLRALESAYEIINTSRISVLKKQY